MKKRTKQQTERFYRQLLAEQRRSGLSIRAFARERGVPAGTLSAWTHELKKRDAARAARQESGPEFVPVSVVGAEGESGAPPAESRKLSGQWGGAPQRSGYEVEFGAGRVLRLPPDFDDARAVALVRAVASC